LNPQLAVRAAGRLLLQEFDRLAKAMESFAIESTLSGKGYIDRLMELKADGYELNIIFLKLNSPKLALERVAFCVRQGGHQVPKEDIKHRFVRGWANFVQHYRPLADEWAVYDNSGITPILLEQYP